MVVGSIPPSTPYIKFQETTTLLAMPQSHAAPSHSLRRHRWNLPLANQYLPPEYKQLLPAPSLSQRITVRLG